VTPAANTRQAGTHKSLYERVVLELLMQPVSPAATRYDAATIIFHWLTALLVVGQWVGAQVIDWFPPGRLRVDARSMHIVAGSSSKSAADDGIIT